MSMLLEVRHLSTVFHTRSGDITAVNDVSYDLEAGRSLAIVGESGSGKTVSALSLIGLVPSPGKIVGGQIKYNGEDLTGMSENRWRQFRGRDIAMIFQDPMTAMNPVLTIGTQLTEALVWNEGKTLEQATARVVETMEMVGIPDAARRLADYPHQFSGGQRQRIMIAMAIVCRPSLLIADEPTTALDVTIQAQIVALIEELRERLDMAVIWITHDLGLIAGIVDSVAVMYAGSIVEFGPVRDVFGNSRHPYTRGLMASIPRFDAERQARLESIEGTPPDLATRSNGCAFAPRCGHRVAKCQREAPVLDENTLRHRVACWEALK
jgi:oligopeptide/dipeptide ABC transporter ATP-binding protein